MSEYTGGLNNGVFAFLDSLQPSPEKYQLPVLQDNTNLARLERECGAKLLKGLSDILLDSSIKRGEHKKAISELHARLKELYPQFADSLRG
jgi:hypothetical protein